MLTGTLLALGAAVLHATWNLLLKTSDDRDSGFWAQWLLGAIVSVPVLAVTGLPLRASWPFLLASSLVHVGYVLGLARAYHHGDFSFAYPLARGSAALLAALGGVVLLGDHLHAWAWVGIAVVAVGIFSLMGRRASHVSLRWAVATGLTIACYTLVDAAGARRAGSGIAYGFSLQVTAALAISVAGLSRGGAAGLVRAMRTSFWRYLAAGALVGLAYSLVLTAFRYSPVGYVSMLRESSVVIGALLGWALLREPLARRRLAASVVMAAGLALLVAGS